MEKFGLLELTPIGVGFVVVGILYFATLGRFFLKKIAQRKPWPSAVLAARWQLRPMSSRFTTS